MKSQEKELKDFIDSEKVRIAFREAKELADKLGFRCEYQVFEKGE